MGRPLSHSKSDVICVLTSNEVTSRHNQPWIHVVEEDYRMYGNSWITWFLSRFSVVSLSGVGRGAVGVVCPCSCAVFPLGGYGARVAGLLPGSALDGVAPSRGSRRLQFAGKLPVRCGVACSFSEEVVEPVGHSVVQCVPSRGSMVTPVACVCRLRAWLGPCSFSEEVDRVDRS